MADIREYENLDKLENWIISAWTATRNNYADIHDISDENIHDITLEEVIVAGERGRGTPRGEDDPIHLVLVLGVEGAKTSQSEKYTEIGTEFSDILEDEERRNEISNTPMPQSVREDFPGIRITTIPDDILHSAMNKVVNIREGDPNRAFSLTRREDIVVTEDGIERGEMGTGEGANILQFPDLEYFRDELLRAYQSAEGWVASQNEGQSRPIKNLSPEKAVFVGEFGDGTAEKGEDPFDIVLFLEKGSALIRESRIYRSIQSVMVEDEIRPSDDMTEWSTQINLTVTSMENYKSVITNRITPGEERGYDILNDQIITTSTRFLRGAAVSEEDADVLGERVEDEDEGIVSRVASAVGRGDDDQPTPGDVPDRLSIYSTDEGKIRVPINKDTKTVNPRDPYDFEVEMWSPNTNMEGCIGYAKATGRYGEASRRGNAMPPSMFPRTGYYIRNRLYYEGPAYALEMYNDLVVYSAYISRMFDARHVVGSYESFREFLYRLKEVHKRDKGPQLIEELSQQQAAARGLSTIPELPTGEKAPWLERRQYYDIVDDNIHHEAWDNVGEYIYG